MIGDNLTGELREKGDITELKIKLALHCHLTMSQKLCNFFFILLRMTFSMECIAFEGAFGIIS